MSIASCKPPWLQLRELNLQPQALADRILFPYSSPPILPIPLVRIVTDLGVTLKTTAQPSTTPSESTLFINPIYPLQSRRFTIACMLGQLLHTEPHEFATHLIVPLWALYQTNPQSIAELSELFNVDPGLIECQIRKLGY